MLNDIFAPLAAEEFFREYRARRFAHIPGPADKFSHLFPWEVLNRELEGQRFDTRRLALVRRGRKIDAERYMKGHWVDSGKLLKELQTGATLIFNSCDEVHPPLRELCAQLGSLFHHRVFANLYASWRRDNGFNVHADDQNNIILQVSGRKRWKVWQPDAASPSDAPSGEPVWDGILEEGGLLSIPRGWWHVAYPMDEPSLHLTVTMESPRGIDFLHWMADRMKLSAAAREDVPILATDAEREIWRARLRAEWLAAWDEISVDQFLADLESKVPPRPRISLPGDVDGRRKAVSPTTLLELSDGRPVEFSVREGRTVASAGGFQWRMDAEVAEKLAVFNDGRPHSIAELSPVPDLRLTALAGTLILKGVLRPAADRAEA